MTTIERVAVTSVAIAYAVTTSLVCIMLINNYDTNVARLEVIEARQEICDGSL